MGANNYQTSNTNKVEAAFARIPKPRPQTNRAICKARGLDRSWNTTQFCVPHLETCEPYQKQLELTGGELTDTQRVWQARQARNTDLSATPKATSSIKTYFKTNYKPYLDDLFAQAIYTSTASFSTFETPE